MGDAEEVVEKLGTSPDGVSFIGLVLNERGLDRALETTVDEVNFAVGASEGFNRANAGASPDETMTAIEAMVPRARHAGRKTTVTISVAFGCPYDGEVPVPAVETLAARAANAGADEVALGDTIGVAVPSDVTARLAAVADDAGDARLRVHFHDTRNTAIANVAAALEGGVAVVDASVGGAGGCPFAPNATGNVATEDVLYLLDRMGIDSGVDPEAVMATTPWLSEQLHRPLPAAVTKAGWWPPDARV
jgi:hydroxymethylglutaryl-CoA lyase